MRSREIVTIQVGGTGRRLGTALIETMFREHRIDTCTGLCMEVADTPGSGENVSAFFNCCAKTGKHIPRSISCDTQFGPTEDTPFADSKRALTPVASIFGDQNTGSGNCYASAFHTEGPPIAQRVLDVFRKEVEKCDSLQGVQFLHSTSGGAGSGLTGLLMKTIHDYLDCGSKCILYSACTVPAPKHNEIVLESYNTALALQDLTEYCHMVLPFDTCGGTQTKDIARSLSGLTSSIRFPGILNADLRKIHSNLVPFKNAHFLMSSFTVSESADERPAMDLTHRAMDRDAVLLSVDPQRKGARYLATLLAFRGSSISASHVDEVSATLQRTSSRFDPFFPDWIPNSISASIAAGPVESLTAISNSTSIHTFFDRVLLSWDKQFKAKSHLYLYEDNGIHAEEMLEARNLVQYVSDQYREYSQWPDKIVNMTHGREMTINETAIRNDEQRAIANELCMLDDCLIPNIR